MCGIVGVVSQGPVNQLIYDALLLLQHRGQDAAGIVTLQGRKVYLVPQPLRKSAAALEVARRVDADVVLAAGDSLLDAGMLEAADAAVRPAHGELHDAGWHRPHLRVTTAAGLLGGEQVLENLLAVAGVTAQAG